MRYRFIPTAILLVFLSACSTGIRADSQLHIVLTTVPDPVQVGNGQIVINVTNAAEQPLDGADVEVSLGMSSMTMSTQDGQAVGQGHGRYTSAAIFHNKGDYTVRVWVSLNGQALKTQDFSFSIK